MKFWTAVKTCFKKYFDFSGRAQRSEYWWFYLFLTVVGIALIFVDGLIYPFIFPGQVTDLSYGEAVLFGLASDTTLISNLFSLLTIIPTISAGARRLHDINRSGWWQGIFIVPAIIMGIGAGLMFVSSMANMNVLAIILLVAGGVGLLAVTVLLIVWLATDSDKSDNRFGSSPKYGSQAHTFD